MKCFQVFHLFNQSQGRENLWTFCASETWHFNNHFESFFFIYYYFGDIFIKLAERSICLLLIWCLFFFSFFSSALQTPLGSAGQPPPPSIKIFPSVWRVEAPSQRRIVVRSWRTPILCLCTNKIKNNAPDVSSAPLTAGGGGGGALATAERRRRRRRKKKCNDNHWLHRPSQLPMLISPSSEVEEHLNPTLLNSYCKLQTTTTTTPEILGTRWLAKENGIICV